MTNTSRMVLIAVAIFFGCLGLDWIVMGNQFFMYKFFAPKQEEVARKVYEQTKQYRQGNIRRLNELCVQVSSADEGHIPMLNDVISHEFAEWDLKDVPDYLKSCLEGSRK